MPHKYCYRFQRQLIFNKGYGMKILVLLGLLLTVNVSKAGIHVEPYLGYMLFGDADDDTTTSGTEYDLDYHPILLGGKFGYNYLGFMGGLDISLSPNFTLQTNTKTGTSNTTNKYDYSASYIGLFAGYNLPALFRVWVTYYFKAELEGEEPPVSGNEFKGSGLGIGGGYTGFPIPFISVNAELRKPSFDESFTNSTGTTVAVDYSAFELFISISAQFDL